MNLFIFSRLRNELMGVATLLIVICHTTKFNLVMPSWLFTLLGNCGVGVDIFLFLSGLGIFYSYLKRKESSVPLYKWLIRRYLRIVIPCAFFIIPITLYEYSYSTTLDLNGILLNLSGYGFLVGKGSLWFVACILLLYVITPLIHSLLYNDNRYLYAFVLSVLSLLFGYIRFSDNEIVHKLQFMACRFPCYFIGYAMAKDIISKKCVAGWKMILMPLLGYCLLFVANQTIKTHFSLFWLQGLFLVTIVALMLKLSFLVKCHSLLRFLGVVSLESYAANIMLLPFFRLWNFEFWGINLNMGGWSFYVIGTLICLLVACVVNRLSKKIIEKVCVII